MGGPADIFIGGIGTAPNERVADLVGIPFLLHFLHRWWAWIAVIALIWLARRVRKTDRFASIAVHSAFGFMVMSWAYKNAQASSLAPFEYVMIIWVTILSYLVWNEIPDPPTVLGIGIIIASGIYVLRREQSAGDKPLAYTGLTRR